ncbi:MAG: FAD-dependent monooxygenase [Acidimicrobiales bacterium]
MQPGETGTEFDAVIVGGGPVGATAAIQLANAGYRVAIVEESTFPYPYPRAVMLDGYSLSILGELLGDRAVKIETKPTAGAGYYLDKDDLDQPFATPKAAFGDERRWFFQPELEAVLRDAIAANDNIEALFGWSARKLYRSHQAVLTVQDLSSGETRELTSRYLLGCDGAGSFVRKQTGGSLTTLGDTVLFLIVDARVPADALRGTPGWAYQIVDQDRPTTYLPMGVHDHVRWEFRINPDDDILELQSPDRILELIEPFADRERIELVRHTVYKFNSLIASQWRDGNVFVCGDAAHQTSPFLGQGLNMGIRNTRNLCTKLDLVMSGAANDRLLDQYQAECFDPTKATIKEALRMGKLLFNTSAPANALRHFVGTTVRRGKPIDITKALMPATMTLGDAGRLPSDLKKALPRVRVELADTGETSLLALAQHRPKVLIASQTSVAAAAVLDELPEPVRPLRFVATDDLSDPVDGTAIRFVDADLRAKLFGDDEYVVLAENSAVIGRYAKGSEAQMVADVRSVFQLR